MRNLATKARKRAKRRKFRQILPFSKPDLFVKFAELFGLKFALIIKRRVKFGKFNSTG